MKRLLIIGVIWFGCAVAWMILGTAMIARSGEASGELTGEVHKLWGPPMQQRPPRAVLHDEVAARTAAAAAALASGNAGSVPAAAAQPQPGQAAQAGSDPAQPSTGQPATAQVDGRAAPVGAPDAAVAAESARKTSDVEIPVAASDITVGLDLEQRKKGLIWFPTYAVDFRARYTFSGGGAAGSLLLSFPLEARDVVYDGFQVSDEAGAPIDAVIKDGSAQWSVPVGAGESKVFQVAYRARGTKSWHYQLTAGTGQTKSFRLAMKADTDEIDFPAGTLSPSSTAQAGGAWQGEWAFSSLIANAPIGVELPQRVNPGPLAARITFFAPVGLLFFFFVIAISSAYRNKEIHPLNYFFFGCAFFAFHLLFSYLVDHLSIAPSFTIAAAVSVLLVVTYARLFTGWTFALREMGVSQLLYLVLFSLTFLWTGFTGLAITVGAVLSLFVMMQLTGRARWSFLDGPMRPESPTSPPPGSDVPAAPPAGVAAG
jgi:hypothetical protein